MFISDFKMPDFAQHLLGYWIGVTGGLPLIARYGGYIGVRKSHINKAHAFFERNG